MLLLDEPFSALDALTRRYLREEVKGLKKAFSFPVIYVTHDLNEAFFLADELISVVEGKRNKDWMQMMIKLERSEDIPAPSVLSPRLSLVGGLNKL